MLNVTEAVFYFSSHTAVNILSNANAVFNANDSSNMMMTFRLILISAFSSAICFIENALFDCNYAHIKSLLPFRNNLYQLINCNYLSSGNSHQ